MSAPENDLPGTSPGTMSGSTSSGSTSSGSSASGSDGHRSVDLAKAGDHLYQATNARGATLRIGEGDTADFTPVELLLAAMAACAAIDIDYITGKRAPFATFAARSTGLKTRDAGGNRLVDLQVVFDVTFPDGEAGDAAREVLPSAIQRSQDRLCTVGRTLTLGSPVSYVAGVIDA